MCIDEKKHNEILKKIGITKPIIIGRGGHALAYSYKKDEILKICMKVVGFENAEDFKNTTDNVIFSENSIKFLKINRILYEDEEYFAYTQKKIDKKLKHENSDWDFTISLFYFIKDLLENKLWIQDIGMQNFGIINDKKYLFDFHDLKKIERMIGAENKCVVCRLLNMSSISKKGVWYADFKTTPPRQWWKTAKDDGFGEKYFGDPKLTDAICSLIKFNNNKDIESSINKIEEFINENKK